MGIDTENIHKIDPKDPHMWTYSEKKFFMLRPEVSMVDLSSVVESMGNIARWTGHGGDWFKVAHHSLLVMDIVADLTSHGDEEAIKAGLCHDFPEAYFNDLSAPQKAAMKALGFNYKKFTEPIERVVCEYFKCVYPFPEVVHEADVIAAKIEYRDMFIRAEDDIVPKEFRHYSVINYRYENVKERLREAIVNLCPHLRYERDVPKSSKVRKFSARNRARSGALRVRK